MIETLFDWGGLRVKNSLSPMCVVSECPKLSFERSSRSLLLASCNQYGLDLNFDNLD